MVGITYINNFLEHPDSLFESLKTNVEWDEKMIARKTASFGVAYNYSQMSYPSKEMPHELSMICNKVNNVIGFEPNNCLINYYLNGKSKMGFHSDQTDILETNTGIVIVSLGDTFRFFDLYDTRTTIRMATCNSKIKHREFKNQFDPTENKVRTVCLTSDCCHGRIRIKILSTVL